VDDKFFMVIGGDHSSAIGTWSGAFQAIKQRGSLGLIWIDAHMDSHQPKTSHTGNIHGMPLACLLGYGEQEFTQLLSHHHKLDSRYLCLIGVRSFESEEAEFLKQLNVKIYYMDEVKQRGLSVIMQEAIKIVSEQTAGFGVSIDIDSMDPKEAPGTGVIEPDGLSAKELGKALHLLTNNPKLIGIELAEFDPTRDKQQLTEKVILELMRALFLE
jgi:arginase